MSGRMWCSRVRENIRVAGAVADDDAVVGGGAGAGAGGHAGWDAVADTAAVVGNDEKRNVEERWMPKTTTVPPVPLQSMAAADRKCLAVDGGDWLRAIVTGKCHSWHCCTAAPVAVSCGGTATEELPLSHYYRRKVHQHCGVPSGALFVRHFLCCFHCRSPFLRR